MSQAYLERIRAAFQNEAIELLSELDSALLELESNPSDEALMHRAFRAIHTLKGSGATAGYERLAEFAHTLEGALDAARDRRIEVTPELVDTALRSCDILRTILDGGDGGPSQRETVAALARLLPQAAQQAPAASQTSEAPASATAYEIVFRPLPELFHSGSDPVTLLDELRTLGTCHVVARTDRVPLFGSLDPLSCYLHWDIRLVTGAGEQAIRDVFMFVDMYCELTIARLDDQAAALAVLSGIPAATFEMFITETRDRLVEFEQAALALEAAPSSINEIHAAFRAVHSIKGNAGVVISQAAFGFVSSHPLLRLRDIAHAAESMLAKVRDAGGAGAAPDLVDTLLKASDAMGHLLSAAERQGGPVQIEPNLLERLGLQNEPNAPPTAATADRRRAFLTTVDQCFQMIESGRSQLESSAPDRSALKMYQRGLKTLSAAAEYDGCAALAGLIAPQLIILDRALKGDEPLSVRDRDQLNAAYEKVRASVAALQNEPKPDPAAPAAKPPAASAPAASSTVRVDQEKLDRLMRIVGELLVARGSFPLLAQKLNNSADPHAVAKELKDAGAQISRIAEELQASVMSLRMMPVKTLFQRFPRMVRDLSRAMNKEVAFTTSGDDTELDKTILEQISDPLVHLVRNAVDHGIEPPETRRSKGKLACGQLKLEAATDASGVRIQITDDGAGLDTAKLKQKAFEKGLITAREAESLSDQKAFQLIFAPGLSTAAKVTDVSGRGVGMDVVRNNIAALQGTIHVDSWRERGTQIEIRLPTSLMISKGILLEAAGEEYILPLANIRDMVKIPAGQVRTYRGQAIATVRGRVSSLVSLARIFGREPAVSPELNVAIIEDGKSAWGLIADRFVSEVEVLVKPLTGGLAECSEFLGAAIMGDGRVVLVINPGECVRTHSGARAMSAGVGK